MSLFIGRLPRDIRTEDIEDLFGKYGRLKRCDLKGSFGFVTFESEQDAEKAIEECKGKEVLGSRINVEWATGNKDRRRSRSPPRSRRDDKCFECGERGHWSRNCPNKRRRGGGYRDRSRSRSPDDRRRRRSRSRSRSPRRERSRERDRSPRRERSRERERSRSPKKSKRDSPSRSPRESPRKNE